jgi:hypothetical protein
MDNIPLRLRLRLGAGDDQHLRLVDSNNSRTHQVHHRLLLDSPLQCRNRKFGFVGVGPLGGNLGPNLCTRYQHSTASRIVRVKYAQAVRCSGKGRRLCSTACDLRYTCDRLLSGGDLIPRICSPFVCGGRPKRYDQTKNNTQHGQKLVIDCKFGPRKFVYEHDGWELQIRSTCGAARRGKSGKRNDVQTLTRCPQGEEKELRPYIVDDCRLEFLGRESSGKYSIFPHRKSGSRGWEYGEGGWSKFVVAQGLSKIVEVLELHSSDCRLIRHTYSMAYRTVNREKFFGVEYTLGPVNRLYKLRR